MANQKPADPNALMATMAQAIDHLGGQVAAIMAYVAQLPGADSIDTKSAKALAQQLAPNRIGPLGKPSPADRAEQAVDRIQSMAHQLATIQRAGGRKDAQP